MTLPTTPPILSELRSSTTSASQLTALKTLKNDIIGHGQKKRMWIGLGVLPALARILSTPRANGKRRESNGNRSAHPGKAVFGRTDEEEARLQAIIIVGSLASGGPGFIPPIRASGVIATLLALLSTVESPAKIVLAALRTLNTIANASTLESLDADDQSEGLIHSLYTDDHLPSIVQLLSQVSSSHLVQHQISLTAALIASTCHDESQRNLSVQAGVLEALASQLSTFIGTTNHVLCSPRGVYRPPTYLEVSAATAQSWLAPVLAAIGTIVNSSRSRITNLLSTPALITVLSRFEPDIAVPHEEKSHQWPHPGVTPSGTRLSSSSRLDYLLPQLPAFSTRRSLPETSHHLPKSSSGTSARQPSSARESNHAYDTVDGRGVALPQEEENPLVAWLIYIARAENGITRLMAAWLIGLFYGSGVIDKRRDVSFAMLLVPLLVRMLYEDVKSTPNGHLPYNSSYIPNVMPKSLVQAPAILAMLTLDSLELQRAAVDAGAIRKLAKLLKESYDPLPAKSETSQWTAEPDLDNTLDNSQERICIGDFTRQAIAYRMLQLRESVLKALASLASLSDDYRKTIIENGVVPFVIESLKPKLKLSSLDENQQDKADENYAQSPTHLVDLSGVIVAACATARALTRSVSTLRTSVMDAGLAAPLFVLLEHSDVRVQIAATEVVSNIALEFSPMREVSESAGCQAQSPDDSPNQAILENEIHKVLCDHAHSADSSLRYNAVWALAHLVSSAPKLLRKSCLSNLGPEWLLQICNDGDDCARPFGGARSDREASISTPLAMGTPNAAGEQVDLLNATDGSEEGRQGAKQDDDDDSNMIEAGAPDQGGHSSPPKVAPHQVETTITRHGRADELAMQIQGLSFIRNLICGGDAAEMIDYLFEQLGQERLFEMLIGKLRPRLVNAFNRERRSTEKGVRQTQPQSEIVTTVLYIIVHMAAGSPRQRQVVVSQPELMKLIISLFSHSGSPIRVACVWVVINLTIVDDQSDYASCKQRIQQLKRLGLMEKLKLLESDVEMDVRERLKTVMYQLSYFDRP
ncbi:MAG: hypothetical protein Q9186_000168 [Xanthomendoza sp. 1 TL-2023]